MNISRTVKSNLRKERAVKGYHGIYFVFHWDDAKKEYVDPRRIRGCKAKPFRAVKRIKQLGVRRKIQAKFYSLAEAREWQNTVTEPKNPRALIQYTFCNLVQDWQEWSVGRYYDSTIEQYSKEVRHMKYLFNLPVEELTAEDIDAWLQYLTNPKYPKAKCRTSYTREVKTLLTILNYYREYKNSRYQPPVLKRHKRDAIFVRTPRRKKQPLTVEQLENVLKWLRTKSHKKVYYYLAATQALSGPRIGEACGLKWSDVDWKNQRYTINRIVSWSSQSGDITVRAGNKTDEIRVVKICPRLVALLKEWETLSGNCEYIFHNNGELLTKSAVPNAFNQAFESLGLSQRGTHIFRHTFATIHADQTKDIRATQGALGHRDLRTTQHYANVSERTQAQALSDFRLGQLPEPEIPTPAPGGKVIPLVRKEKETEEPFLGSPHDVKEERTSQ